MWHRAFKASLLLTMVKIRRAAPVGTWGGSAMTGAVLEHPATSRITSSGSTAPLPRRRCLAPRHEDSSHPGRRQLQGALTRRPGRSSSGR
jgi:hypothetical protein